MNFEPDENEVQRWVEQLQAEQRQRNQTAHRFRRLYLDTEVITAAAEKKTVAFGDGLKLVTNSDVLARLWKRLDPTGAKREAWRRVHGRELTTPFEMYGFELSEVTHGSPLVWQKGGVPFESAPASEPVQQSVGPPAKDERRERHDRRVSKVQKQYSNRGLIPGTLPYEQFYSDLGVSIRAGEFTAWLNDEQRRCGSKKRAVLDQAADELPD